MSKIVPFTRGQKAHSHADLSSLLQEAVYISTSELGQEENGLFRLAAGVSKLWEAMLAKTLLIDRRIEYGLFFCSLYVAKTFADFVAKVPESFYAADYFIRGHAENNPRWFRDGADLCCFICVFCEGRTRWRSLRPKDFQTIGTQLYLTYYHETSREIGWHMAKNFTDIVDVAKRSLNAFKRN